jgi:hypothetical protein
VRRIGQFADDPEWAGFVGTVTAHEAYGLSVLDADGDERVLFDDEFEKVEAEDTAPSGRTYLDGLEDGEAFTVKRLRILAEKVAREHLLQLSPGAAFDDGFAAGINTMLEEVFGITAEVGVTFREV